MCEIQGAIGSKFYRATVRVKLDKDPGSLVESHSLASRVGTNCKPRNVVKFKVAV